MNFFHVIYTYPRLCKVFKLEAPLQSLPIRRQRPLSAVRYKQRLKFGGALGRHESGKYNARAGQEVVSVR